MTIIWKSDLFRLIRSKWFYAFEALTCLIPLSLMLLIRQDIRLGISIFGNQTILKKMDDIIRMGAQYQKGLGIFVAILLSVFIGQEYAWKTWQHKWIIKKNRTKIYLSKVLLSSMVSIAAFLIFEGTVLISSGQITNVLTKGYMAFVICSVFLYAALGSVICMLSMLIKNSTVSVIVCLGYVLCSETFVSIIKGVGSLTEITAGVSEWITSHSVYGMSLFICSKSVSLMSILPIFMNSATIIFLSTLTGWLLFRKYEL